MKKTTRTIKRAIGISSFGLLGRMAAFDGGRWQIVALALERAKARARSVGNPEEPVSKPKRDDPQA